MYIGGLREYISKKVAAYGQFVLVSNVNQCEVRTCNDIKLSMTNNEFQFKIIKLPFLPPPPPHPTTVAKILYPPLHKCISGSVVTLYSFNLLFVLF